MSILRRLLKRFRSDQRGAVATLVALALVPVTAVTAVGVDSGRVWVERQRIQTAAEAAAMAAAGVWANTGTACDANALLKVRENAGSEATWTCSTTGSRYDGVITVAASKTVSAVFGRIIGHQSTTVSSTASVLVGAVSSATGVRPNALCAANTALTAWKAGGYSSSATYRIGVDQSPDGDEHDHGHPSSPVTGAQVCDPVAGNWSMVDYDGGSHRIVDSQRWIDDGYEGDVEVGHNYSGDPGVPAPSLDFNRILGQTIVIPVYDTVTGTGSNAVYHVSSFVGIQIVSTTLSGPVSGRNVTVRFKPVALSNAGCSHGAAASGVVTWRPCSLDGKGTCS